MRGVVFTTDCKMYTKDFPEPLYQSIGEEVGGWIETVHPRGLTPPYCMIVNEEGLLRELPINLIGCLWYETQKHGYPIVGNIVVMKDGMRNGEPDIVGLTDQEAAAIMAAVSHISMGRIQEITPSQEGIYTPEM